MHFFIIIVFFLNQSSYSNFVWKNEFSKMSVIKFIVTFRESLLSFQAINLISFRSYLSRIFCQNIYKYDHLCFNIQKFQCSRLERLEKQRECRNKNCLLKMIKNVYCRTSYDLIYSIKSYLWTLYTYVWVLGWI